MTKHAFRISPPLASRKELATGRRRLVIGSLGGLALFGMVAAFATAPSNGTPRLELRTVVETLSPPLASAISNESATFLHEELIQRSDSIASLFNRLGIVDRDALEFIRGNETAQVVSRQLRPGKTVSAQTNENGELLSLYFPLNGKDAVLTIKRDSKGFAAIEENLLLETRTHIKSGEIRHSLFGATDAAGIPDSIATQLAEIFGADIDFYRDLRKGDRFSLVYETLSHRGQIVRSGRILSAEFTNNQKSYQAYWFSSGDNKGGYYTAEGKSLRKAFLRSPLEFSRVTSGFTTARFHPVLQTWRAHKGVDYGAPIGTRVRAVADGTVEFAGRQNGYGNLVVIKHQGKYSTAYGHLNGFGQNVRKGTRVSQGDLVGYVGKTGLASGPHLHYEFRVNNQQINPLALALPTAVPLEASQLARYKKSVASLREQLDLAKQLSLAMAE